MTGQQALAGHGTGYNTVVSFVSAIYLILFWHPKALLFLYGILLRRKMDSFYVILEKIVIKKNKKPMNNFECCVKN